MTQPVPADTGGGGQILATAAVALALIALEQQASAAIEDAVTAAFTTIAAAAVVAASTAPATVVTGVALLSLASFHTTLVRSVDKARNDILGTVEVAYSSAAQIAQTKLTADFARLGYQVPNVLPELDATTDAIFRDLDTALGYVQTEIQNRIRVAYDGIQGLNEDIRAVRVIAVRQAVLSALPGLRQRVQAALTTAIQRGSTDASQAIYTEYQNTTGHPGLMKEWRTTSTDPCGMCEALHGNRVGITAEFDHNATTSDKDYRRVWRNLSGPPRHPHCRCQLVLVQT